LLPATTVDVRQWGNLRPADELAVRELFTVGYAGRTPDDLVLALRAVGIERVVDVRELPLSRRPGFSKTRLAAALDREGIRYDHVRALGNPKNLRDRYKGGDSKGGARAYRAHLDAAAAPALAELAESVTRERSCLLCLEASHLDCHRAVIAEALTERLPEITVVHL
jgi:uncharacterized protein (DUF488 family)